MRIVRLVLLVFAVTGNFLGTILESKLLMSYFYYYDYQVKICLPYTGEGQVSRADERYLYSIVNNTRLTKQPISFSS